VETGMKLPIPTDLRSFMEDNSNVREILEKLVSFPTVSRDTNLPLVEWVESYLSSHGVSSERVASPCGMKAHLYAQVGPETDGGVILSGHTDVVPVDGQAWTTDPWTLTERDGKLFGRGACDMKGFDALALMAWRARQSCRSSARCNSPCHLTRRLAVQPLSISSRP
jgi:acetylornithine deacetylase